MLERIDPKLLRAGETLPVAGGADRQPGREPQRHRRPHAPPGHEDDQSAEQIDEALARLAAVIADVERLAREESGITNALYPLSAHDVAIQIARNGAGAIAAQASLGPAGVRLVLDARHG